MYMKKVFYLPLYRSCDAKFFHDWLFYVNLCNFVPWCQHFVQLISTLIKSYYCYVYILRNYQHYHYKVASTQCPSKIAAAEPDPWCHYCSFVFYYHFTALELIPAANGRACCYYYLSLSLSHFCLYWNNFSIVECIRCQLFFNCFF